MLAHSTTVCVASCHVCRVDHGIIVTRLPDRVRTCVVHALQCQCHILHELLKYDCGRGPHHKVQNRLQGRHIPLNQNFTFDVHQGPILGNDYAQCKWDPFVHV